MELKTQCTWHYMVDGSIVVKEEGQPLKVIEPQEDGYIRFQLQKEGPAMTDPPIRLATADENYRFLMGW